ncbi:MAG: hypothetical protein KGV51_02035 [Moraxellaceae bacterium]|nr:hypothetical protein [Moraxellaceae bacterium]
MKSEYTNFIIHFPISEIVYWGKDEFDDDDFYPNTNLQKMINHIGVPLSLCYIYKRFFDRNSLDFYKCHLFESDGYVKNYLLLNLDVDKRDQHDCVTLIVKCHQNKSQCVRDCLTAFLQEIQENNPVVQPYNENSEVIFLENYQKRHC